MAELALAADAATTWAVVSGARGWPAARTLQATRDNAITSVAQGGCRLLANNLF